MLNTCWFWCKNNISQNLDNLQFTIKSNIDQFIFTQILKPELWTFVSNYNTFVLFLVYTTSLCSQKSKTKKMKYNVISGTWKNPSPQTPLNLDSCNIIVGNNFSIQDDPHMWGPYPSIILKTYEVKRLLCTTHTRAKSWKMFGMELKTLIIRHLFWLHR